MTGSAEAAMDYEYFLYAYKEYIYPNIGVGFIVAAALLFVVLVLYVLKGLGLWRIARAREIKNFAMAFVPIGSSWLTGLIADRYEAAEHKRPTKLRKVILLTGLASFGLSLIFTAAFICVFYYSIMSMQLSGMQMPEILPRLLWLLTAYYIAVISAEAIGIVHRVFYCMALYRIYMLKYEKLAVLFTVLSAVFFFFAPITLYIAGRSMRIKMSKRRTRRQAVQRTFLY